MKTEGAAKVMSVADIDAAIATSQKIISSLEGQRVLQAAFEACEEAKLANAKYAATIDEIGQLNNKLSRQVQNLLEVIGEKEKGIARLRAEAAPKASKRTRR